MARAGRLGTVLRCSCGYVGTTDGWQDLAHNFRMDWEFDCAPDGNIALTGELDIRQTREFVLVLAFGESLHHALVTTAQTLSTPFADHRARFIEQWQDTGKHMLPGKDKSAGDDGRLYRVSHSIILAHEDKTYDGALIASLSIPWGEAMSDGDTGGYHLVWTRDMCNSATGLLAAGTTEVPLRALSIWPAPRKRMAASTRISGSTANPTGAASSWTRRLSPLFSPGVCIEPRL